jgi:nucleotide-binding universal stress UspA family protein
MTYRSLLVHLDHDAQCPQRVQFAITLARRLDCHLVGLAPTGLLDLPGSIAAETSLAQYSALAWDVLRDRGEKATQAFRDACRAAGLKSFEAVVDEADKAQSLARHAHCSDLALMSQPEPGLPGHAAARELVEQVVMNSARPTLVMPYAGRFDTVGETAMVAWDDSREAARAVSDALPLLRLARQVQVVSWNEDKQAAKAIGARIESLHHWLMWQGVSAEVHVEPVVEGVRIADAMLSRAADLDADLIVMGAYGHARWIERVMGGATRGLLDTMTVPTLMSR